MEKRDYIWVAIRIFGIYLLVKAVIVIPMVAGALLQTYNTYNCRDLLPDLGKWQHANAMTTLLQSVLEVLIYSLVGVYLTFRGKLVFQSICPPDEPKV